MVLPQQKSSAPASDSSAPAAPSGIGALVKVAASAKMLFFTVIVFLSGFSGSLIDTFLNVYLNTQGAPGVLMGTARMLT